MGTIRWKSQSLKWRLSWCSDLKPTSRLSVFNSCTPQTRKYLYIKLFCLQVGVVSNLFTSPGYRVHFQPSLTSAAAADWLLKWQAVHLSIYLFFIKDLMLNIGSPVFFSLFFFYSNPKDLTVWDFNIPWRACKDSVQARGVLSPGLWSWPLWRVGLTRWAAAESDACVFEQ